MDYLRNRTLSDNRTEVFETVVSKNKIFVIDLESIDNNLVKNHEIARNFVRKMKLDISSYRKS